MKHLKRFNEELSSSTYSKVASILSTKAKKSGNNEFKKRSDALYNHRDIQALKHNIKHFSKYGKTMIESQYNKDGDTVSGEFYLVFDFDAFNFEESYADEGKSSIDFAFGLIPVDMETKEKFSVLPEDDFDNGFFWGGWVTLNFDDDDADSKFELNSIDIYSYDFYISGKISFTRNLCALIKKHLLACFSDESYISNSDVSMYDMLEEEVLIKTGNSARFGIEMSNIKDIISKITPNQLMSSVKDGKEFWR